MRNLHEILHSDPEFDVLADSDLFLTARRLTRKTDRARSLLALSRRVGENTELARTIIRTLDEEGMDARVVGLMTVRLFCMVGLLIHTKGDARAEVLESWNSISSIDQGDVRSAMIANGVEFPW